MNTSLTPELEREGLLREITRLIQSNRKKKGFKFGDEVSIKINTKSKEIRDAITAHKAELMESVTAKDIELTEEDLSDKGQLNTEEIGISIV
jgi:isoleucyl-tRNA synthetase